MVSLGLRLGRGLWITYPNANPKPNLLMVTPRCRKQLTARRRLLGIGSGLGVGLRLGLGLGLGLALTLTLALPLTVSASTRSLCAAKAEARYGGWLAAAALWRL